MRSVKIAEIRPGTSGVDVIGMVIKKTEPRIIRGKPFSQAVIKDESGTILLSLWRGQVGQVNVGDMIKVPDAFCYMNRYPLQIASWSDIIVLSKADTQTRAYPSKRK